MFIDCEGEPVQEMSAIAMDNESYQIVSVYHKHAACDPSLDAWSRKNLHGLNPTYLHDHGFSNESELAANFQCWLKSFNVQCMYANNPGKERELLGMKNIYDILLPTWRERGEMTYHVNANLFKKLSIPIQGVHCSGYVHNSFVSTRGYVPLYCQNEKLLHGYHCSLYDCYEMYLFHLYVVHYWR